jgi:Leucine-rich repeat (LRR) protein
MRLKLENTFQAKINILFVLFFVLIQVGFAQDQKSNKKIKYCTSLQEALLEPESITHLKLRGADLDSIPELISKFTNLMYLDLSKNNIKKIDQTIFNLRSLKELNLSKNQITIIPDAIGGMDVLERLIINQNPISILPVSIAGCRSLEYIDAWGTDIDQLDSALINAPKLALIDLQSIRMGYKTQQAIVDNIKGKITIKMSSPCKCD